MSSGRSRGSPRGCFANERDQGDWACRRRNTRCPQSIAKSRPVAERRRPRAVFHARGPPSPRPRRRAQNANWTPHLYGSCSRCTWSGRTGPECRYRGSWPHKNFSTGAASFFPLEETTNCRKANGEVPCPDESASGRQAGVIGYDFHEHAALAGAIELAQKNALSGTQNQPVRADKYRLRSTGQDRLHMRVRVPFHVAIRPAMRDDPVEDSFDIAGYIRIGVFIDSYACGGVRHIHVAQPVFYARFVDGFLNRTRDIHQLGAPAGFDSEGLHLEELHGTGMMKCVPEFLIPECRSISSKAA